MKQMIVIFIDKNGKRIGYRGSFYACERFFKAQGMAGNHLTIVNAMELV